MNATAQVTPELLAFARAVGLLGPDGAVDARWVEHPLEGLRTILSSPHQRAALLELLEAVAPPVADPAGSGARWHPLLAGGGRGNLYLTVDGAVFGVAATLESAAADPVVRGSVRFPLVDVGGTSPVAVAASAAAPVELEVAATWPAGSHPSSVSVLVSADASGSGGMRITLRDLDPAAPTGRLTVLDPAHLDADAARALACLLARGLSAEGSTRPAPVSPPRAARRARPR